MINTHTKQSRAGFTLVELLVVVTILVVLVTILSSVISGAKERARRASCQSNLKQLSVAMQQYVQDNGGVYPFHPARWSDAVYPYIKNPGIFRCPDYPSQKVTDQLTVTSGSVDYIYNIHRLVVFPPPYPSKHIHGTTNSLLSMPATIWLNADAPSSGSGGHHFYQEVPKTSCGRSFIGSTLHSGCGNYSYVDGHVKWLTPEEAGEVECLNGPLPAPFKD